MITAIPKIRLKEIEMNIEEKSRQARQKMKDFGIPHLFDEKVKRLDIPLQDTYPTKQEIPQFLLKGKKHA